VRSTRHARLVTLAGVAAAAGAVNLLSSVRADTPPPVMDVWTWGLGTSGQLGTVRSNATIPSANHTRARWVSVSAGSAHTVALTDTGEVWAWGNNDQGQLGDGTTTQSMLPVLVIGLSGISAIAAGGGHNLAYRASDATLWAWGSNGSGQLARDTSLASSPTPIEITGLGVLRGIAGGATHSIALANDGTVFTWGANLYGQLGTGDFAARTSPVPVALPGPAVAIGAGGAHSLVALASGGAVYTWGWNVFGQLGYGYQGTPTTGEPTPAPALGVTDAVAVTAGDLHCLARTSDGHVWGWGYNTEGQVGNGAVTAANSGVLTPTMLDIDSVAIVDAGGVHSIALKTNGEVWTWGGNQFGQSGNNGRIDELRPVRPIEIGAAVSVTAGGKHSVALAAPPPPSHVAQIGTTAVSEPLPAVRPAVRQLAPATEVSALSAGAHHVLAIDGNHDVRAWGDNSKGQLGMPGPASDDPITVPIPRGTARGFVAVVAVADRSFALRSDGTVWAWGDNANGSLGIGTTTNPAEPTQAPTLKDVIAIAAGERHCLAQDSHGTVWGWGENGNGQLGIPASTIVTAPIVVPYVVGPQHVAAGGRHSLAISGAGEVLAWGAGGRGQLGSARLGDRAIPISVALPRGATTAAVGREHSLVLLAGGDVWGFGDNGVCQLGASPLVYPFTYAPVDVGVRNAIGIQAGAYHSLALAKDHSVVAWGDDSAGQLGRNDLTRAHYDCDPASVGVVATSPLAGGLTVTTVAVEDAPGPSDGGRD
jgi:alpha-tubulin suppressor-like RCC1 family protein